METELVGSMAVTKGQGGRDGAAEVSLRISATNEASSSIEATQKSLSALQEQVKDLSSQLVDLGRSIKDTSGSVIGRVSSIGSATVAATAAIGQQIAQMQEVRQTFEQILDEQLFSRKASIGDMAGYVTQVTKPLIEGAFFGASEDNTKRLIEKKGRKLANDVIDAIGLPKILGEQGAKFGKAGEEIGRAVGRGLTLTLKRQFSGKFGDFLVEGFQQVSNLVDKLYPRILQISKLVGMRATGRARLEQDLADQRLALEIRAKQIEAGRATAPVPGGATLKQVKEAQALLDGSDFDKATAGFRTPEFRKKVVKRIQDFASRFISGPSDGELSARETELTDRRTALAARKTVGGFRNQDTSQISGEIDQIDQAIDAIRAQRKAGSEFKAFVIDLVGSVSGELYDLAFKSLSRLFDDPAFKGRLEGTKKLIIKAFSDTEGFVQEVILNAKFLALEAVDSIGKGVNRVASGIKSVVTGTASAIGDGVKKTTDAVSSLVSGAAKAIESLPRRISAAFESVAGDILSRAEAISAGVSATASKVGGGIGGAGAAAGRFIEATSPLVQGVAQDLAEQFKGDSPEVSEFILARAKEFEALGQQARDITGKIEADFSASGRRVGEVFKSIGSSLSTAVSRTGGGLGGSSQKLIDEAKKIGGAVSSTLGGPLKLLFRDIPSGFKSAFEGTFQELEKIGSGISKRIAKKLELDGSLMDNLKNLAERAGVKEAGTNIGLRLGTAIVDGLSEAARTLLDKQVTQIVTQIDEITKVIPKVMTGISTGLDKAGDVTAAVSGLAEPVQIYGFMKEQVTKATTAIAAASEQVYFFSNAVETVKSVVMGGPYEILIGQNVRLEEQLLSTRASIVANNKVLEEGVKIADPGQAIQKLGPTIEGVIGDIRRKSLELVGVTSKDLIDVFDVVSQQVSNVNLSLEEAGDLTISFAAGLGTIGLPLAQARQEIQSVLSAQIDNNSVLAKSLGLTNAQLKTWVAQDVVYERLNQRLDAFVKGNALAAKTINGISSNIQEIADEIGRVAGAQLMGPVVDQFDRFYNLLSENQTLLTGMAEEGVGQLLEGFTKLGTSASALGKDLAPIVGNIIKLLWETLINVINGVAEGLETLRTVLAPFLPILQAVAGLIKSAGGPLLQLTVTLKVLAGGIATVQGLMGSLIGAVPLLGEALFLLNIRGLETVNTFASLANPQTGIGASAATILLLGRNMNTIPGLAGIVGKKLEAAFGPLSVFLTGAIPAMSTFGLRLFALGQNFEPVRKILAGISGAIPGTISSLSGLADRMSIFGVKFSQFTGPLTTVREEIQGIIDANGSLGDILNKKLTNILQEQGRLARDAAITYGIWGAAVVGLAGSLSLLIIRNTALRTVLEAIYNGIKKIVTAIVDLLLQPLTQTVLLVGSLTTLIATGAATQMLSLAASFAAFAATKAPATLKLMVDRLREFSTTLKTVQAGEAVGAIGNAFGSFREKVSSAAKGSPSDQAAGEAVGATGDGEEKGKSEAPKKEESPDREKKGGQEPQTFGDVELDSDKDKEEKRKKRRKKVGGGKRTGAAADRLDEILDLSEAQAEAANKAGLYEQGMIGSHKSTTQVSKSAKGASVQVTALGQAQQFATATAATLSATFKALFATLGPIVAIIALFSAWGYAIEKVTETSRKQKEMQEGLLEVLKEQEATLAKIQALQGKPVENALADEITEADLKTREERVAFRDGGGEAVLAVRKARTTRDDGTKKSSVRRFTESSLDAIGTGISGAITGINLLGANLSGDESSKAKARDAFENAIGSTSAIEKVRSQSIAGTETLVEAGQFVRDTETQTAPQIKKLGVQVRETEKLLKEAQEKGSEARARELEARLEEEKAAYDEAQDQILSYATSLEKIDFATDAQKNSALAYADDLRGIIQDIEAEIEVAGIDFARLGTSFEQLEVESSNALAFFERGEGNPEQVAQRAGQLLSATQQQLEEGFISSEQALANYAVLFKRNNALELGDQQKLQEAILAARKKQTESAIKLEEAKVAKLKQLAAEGEVGQFESELGNVGLEREKAEIELEGLRTSYEEQNELRVTNFKDARKAIQSELARSRQELAGMSGQAPNAEAEAALLTEIAGYEKKLETLGESFRNQQRSANRNFATEEANLLAQIAESANQELQLRLKELEDQASAALDRSATFRKAQLQELRKEGVISEEQQNFAIARSQQDRNKEELVLERKKLQELLKNPKRFEREIRESNGRIAQLTLERFETERAAWEAQLTLFQRYVNDQAEAARNAIEVENQELIKQAKLYEAIAQGIDQRNALLQKAQGFVESTGGSVADSLERIAKLTGNEVLQADIATNAAIIRRETLAKQLEIQTKIFEIEQKQAEIALIRREAENQIAIAKAKQQIISAQGELVVAQQQFERGDITEAELTSKKISLLTATTELQGLKLEEGLIQQEKELQPVLQGLLKAQQEQQMQSQLDQADIAVLETMPQALALDAMTELGTRFGERLGFTAKDLGELATQMREARGQLQGGYAQEVYGDANIFDDDISFREAQLSVGPGARNIERLKEQGIDLGFYTELGDITASPVANVNAQADGEGFFVEGDTGEAGSGLFDEQTGPLGEILAGVETATTNMDESIAQLEESLGKINLDNLQEALPELVGRDAIVETTFEAAGSVEQAIEQAIQESNAQLETITTGLEPLAEVRDFLGADGPLNKSLENLDLSPYLGENMDLLKDTGAIAQGVEQIVAQMPKAGEEAPAPAEGEGVYGPPLPGEADRPGRGKREIDNLSTRDVNTFLRQFEELISPEALEKARARGSEDGRRVTEGELRTVLVDTLRPMFLSAGSQSRLEQSSTSNILAAFRSAFGVQEQNESRGGRGGRSRTQYEIKPNLTFNINGNADENKIARTAMREFETILDRTLASAN